MKKVVSLVVAAIIAVSMVSAQNVADGIKLLNYQKVKSATETLKKAYDANTKDPYTIYWYGQALLDNDETKAAKDLYQKALQEGVNDPWIWVGMGHVELLEGGDLNAAKQKFEQAITATLETKGKNKGKPNAGILAAIGRANADGGSKVGDPAYGIDKLKQAAELDKTNPDIYISMGKLYQKQGGEMGGEAVKAYMEAIARDPKNADANYRIGKIYASQGNQEQLELYYNKAIAADVAFPPAYYGLYQYYELRDINKAKDYLDKYIQYADKDCATDYYYASYLFRAGQYDQSIAKADQMKNQGCGNFVRLNVLYAYNYDRKGDSVQAKAYLDKFFAAATTEQTVPTDYELAVKVFSKFPGSEAQTAAFLQKAIDNDTSKANRLTYMTQAATMFEKAKMYPQQLEWLEKGLALRGGTLSEYDYYKVTYAALNAQDYVKTISYSKDYMNAFPDKPQPYAFLKKAAISSDPDTSKGLAIEPLNYLDSVYMLRDSVKNKPEVFRNLYYMLQYYVYKAKDLQKALEVTEKMLALYPAPGEENKYALDTRKTIQDALKKQSPGGGKSSSAGPAKSGTTNAGSGK